MGDAQSQLGQGPDGMPTGLLETAVSSQKVLIPGAQRDLKDFAAGGTLDPQLEPHLLTQLLNLLAHRPRHSLLLSDLGALLPGNLRQGVKEKGGLRSWLQKYPEIFQVSGQPGKESVTLLVLGGGGSHYQQDAVQAPAPVGPQQGMSAAELEAAKKREDEDNESAVQLRGLPYRATMQDVKNFLKHHAKNLKDDPNTVQLVLNRDGRPSGFGRVQFKTPEAARHCRDDLHMRVMEVSGEKSADRDRGDRYVEIFLYSERPNKLRFKKAVGETNDGQDDEIEALGITKQHVLDECRQHMSMEGKSKLLLSMLGVALSPGSRLYLKKTDQGLKHFLSSCPDEFSVDGSKGREIITYLPALRLTKDKAESHASSEEPVKVEERKFESRTLPALAVSKAPIVKSSLPLPLPSPSPESPVACAPSKAVSPMPPGSVESSCGHLGTRRGTQSAGPLTGNISDLGGFPPTPAPFPPTPQIDDMVFDMPEVDVPNDEAPESPKATFPSHLDKLGTTFQTPSDWGTPFEAARNKHLHGLGLGLGPMGDLHDPPSLELNSTAGSGESTAAPALPAGLPPQSWSAWGMPPAPFWPQLMMPPMGGDAAQALRSGTMPGGFGSDGAAGLQVMLGTWMAMNGAGAWPQQPWMPEAPSQPAQQEAPQTDFIQKLLKNEIPIPSASQTQAMEVSKTPAAIRLRGLPYEASEQDILAWMAKHDVVDRILESRQAVRVYNKNNGKPMGVAVVALHSKEDADYVLEVLNGQYMKNRYIEVFHHVEGEAGTDKALVQGSNGTTGATSNGSQVKELSQEASKFEGLGDTGGSGGFGIAGMPGWPQMPNLSLTGMPHAASNPQTDPSWESVLDFLKSDGNFAQASLQHSAGRSEKQSGARPGLRIDSM